jgi:hypothetical protein
LGEGIYKVWHQGKVSQVELIFMDNAISRDRECKDFGPNCWARMVEDNRDKEIWWAKIRLEDGFVGWVEVNRNFENIDRCA